MAKIGRLEQHPLSQLFPPMPPDEFRELVEDIRRHGVLEPIELLDGKVFDGWHRYLAAQKAGLVECPSVEWVNPDGERAAFAHVWARNALRRHLTAGQRVAIAIMIHPEAWEKVGESGLFPEEGAGRPPNPEAEIALEKRISPVDQIAHTAGVNQSSVYAAKAVERDAPDLWQQVQRGEIGVQKADEERRKRERYRRTEEALAKERERRERHQRQDIEILTHYVRDVLQTIDRVEQIRKAISDGLRYERFSPEAKPFILRRLDRAIKWLTAAQKELEQ